jgi:hypothetical protein
MSDEGIFAMISEEEFPRIRGEGRLLESLKNAS